MKMNIKKTKQRLEEILGKEELDRLAELAGQHFTSDTITPITKLTKEQIQTIIKEIEE